MHGECMYICMYGCVCMYVRGGMGVGECMSCIFIYACCVDMLCVCACVHACT